MVNNGKFELISNGVVKRRERRVLGLFIDGTGLDRATRRLARRVDMGALVKGLTSGIKAEIARYYTLIPNEDDSRQRAFLEAVERAGLSVIVKRLPPKGITRQVTVDVEMAAEIVGFAMGYKNFNSRSLELPLPHAVGMPVRSSFNHSGTVETEVESSPEDQDVKEQRMIVVVCPSREMSYPIQLARDMGVDTTTADFGQFAGHDIMKSAAKWVDLSTSDTIWRD